MVVLVVMGVPEGLRGFLTKWLMEIAPGVFVGRLSARIRAHLWRRVQEMAGEGRAIIVYKVMTEQGLDFEVYGAPWQPVDHDGLMLVRRPASPSDETRRKRQGWSKASKRRRFSK